MMLSRGNSSTRRSSVGGGTGGTAYGLGASRRASLGASGVGGGGLSSKVPALMEFLAGRDYTGALTLLEFRLKTAEEQERESTEKESTLLWLGYCAFHLGMYQRAADAYQQLLRLRKMRLQDDDDDDVHRGGKDNEDENGSRDGEEEEEDGRKNTATTGEINLFLGCCHYYMQEYEEAEKAAVKGPDGALKNRLLFHVCQRVGDENKLMKYHQKLTDTTEDQLSLAAVHFLRSHFQEATDTYKRLLLDNREDLALNVYVAMCYYKLDYYDVSLEILAVYLQAHPDSAVAVNLKACNHFRLYNGKAALAELKTLSDQGINLNDNDLIRHNMVVFNGGASALQVLPPLVEVLPEARLNLVIHHLRNDQVQEAYELVRDLDAATPQEYTIKGVVNASIGQALGSREHIKVAQQLFQLVGASASECDTIPGRQCMASCFFLLKQFEDVNVYLNSIKAYMYSDDDFNWNHGIALAATGNFKSAEEALSLIQNEKYKSEYTYISWLARCYIMNANPRAAWELYLKMDSSNESFNLLQLIANDCYRMGHFLHAAKAFDVLERLDPDPEYWEGKRGACVGVFQQVIAGKASREDLIDVLTMVRNTSNPQVEYIVKLIRKWSKDNDVMVK